MNMHLIQWIHWHLISLCEFSTKSIHVIKIIHESSFAFEMHML